MVSCSSSRPSSLRGNSSPDVYGGNGRPPAAVGPELVKPQRTKMLRESAGSSQGTSVQPGHRLRECHHRPCQSAHRAIVVMLCPSSTSVCLGFSGASPSFLLAARGRQCLATQCSAQYRTGSLLTAACCLTQAGLTSQQQQRRLRRVTLR